MQDEQTKKDLLLRLKKIEGQVRGVQKMIDDDRYCVDLLIQLAAIRSGVNKVGLSILENHTKGCVAKAVKDDRGDQAIDELMEVINKFIK
ncbi:DNA-binding FrmR family transcriptional regulator [Desulfitispora alkaliphila]|uniref:metal-sensitive transcriptional regulator n=1 Tax=Desulfitispora alkaliphila TaxID=622674 RepID=UPI003D233F5D